ncbi:unnamed protein product [Colias eurytheme]|nr:unnamed protein product [Colias eurytheme]
MVSIVRGARESTLSAAPRGYPFGTIRPLATPCHPPPSLKASGELEEKVPRVYTHMRRTIFGASRREPAGESGLCGDDTHHPVCARKNVRSADLTAVQCRDPDVRFLSPGSDSFRDENFPAP